MLCEMCGNNVPATRQMMVEGTRLSLCPNCAKFGDEAKAAAKSGGSSAAPVTSGVIEERLQRRERRMQTRNLYDSGTTMELIDDYGGEIRRAREERGMSLEDFANSILEKKGILAKVEANDLIPDDKLSAKIEKALNIKLREEVQSSGTVGNSNRSNTMTLSNFIKKE